MLSRSELLTVKDLSLHLHDILILLGKEIVPGGRGTDLTYKLDSRLSELKMSITAVCLDININSTVCHAHPTNRIFKNGDIVTLDLVLQHNGLFADGAWSFICGRGTEEDRQLLKTAWEISRTAFSAIIPEGDSLSMKKDIFNKLKNTNCSLLEDACGHGIGKEIHEYPDISYSLLNHNDVIWKPGMLFTIEPVIASREAKLICRNEKDWITDNNSHTAYFEHMVTIDKNGPLCLNLPQINTLSSIDIFSEIL